MKTKHYPFTEEHAALITQLLTGSTFAIFHWFSFGEMNNFRYQIKFHLLG
jgi:hypothetical protein